MNKQTVTASITGTVISVDVKVGDKVEQSDVLMYIEAMKMENPIFAPIAGIVLEIKVQPQQTVKQGTSLMDIGL